MTAGHHSLKSEAIAVELSGRVVLQSFTAEIKPGDFVAVVGPNGAGKSTALRALAGLAPLAHGRVLIDCAPLDGLPRRDVGRQIGYLPQDRTVHWPLTVERVVALGRLPHRSFFAAESEADKSAIEVSMRRMDVLHLAQRPIVALSGGERARVLVARVLAQEARYLIVDEPTAGLDPAHCLHLFEEFSRLANEGHAIVTALHDLSMALRYAKRVILMKEGCCIADGMASSVLNCDLIAQVFGIDTIVTTIDGIPIVVQSSPLT